MEELYNQLKLTKVGALKHNLLLVKKTNSTDTNTYCLKMPTALQELKLYKDCFPKVNQDTFSRLQLPETIKIGSLFLNDDWWLLMKDYGRDIIPWNETDENHAGGKSITPNYADILIELLQDLKSIDIGLFVGVVPIVDNCPWYLHLLQKTNDLINRGLLPESDLPRITKILSHSISEEQKKDYIITNGDFQFRNFLKQQDGKIVVIDWTENHYNTPNIEPIEFPVMYQWTLMWGNPIWQDLYVKKVMEVFKISLERITFALVVKSINQAQMWMHGGEKTDYYLSRIQIQNCVRALDGEIIGSDMAT